MAIVFTVEDGSCVADANSYVSVAEAQDYLSIKPNLSADWLALTTTDVQNYLMYSTRLLDQRAQFEGVKVCDTSPLRWPRAYVYDKECDAIPNDIVPDQIKAAVAEIAYYLFSSGIDPFGASTGVAGGAIKRIKADVVEIEYTEGVAATSSGPFPPGINDILGGLGFVGSGRTGMGFGRVVSV